MIKEEKFLIAEYPDIRIRLSDAVGLRGFFADIDRSAERIHNHTLSGSSIYRYPQVQYKIHNTHPMVIAFGEGISALYPMVMQSNAIKIGEHTYEDPDIHINLETKKIGDADEMKSYRFINPWMALNQDNYKKYMETEETERESFLNRILIGNILSMCKGFGVNIENKLEVQSDLKPIPIRYKGEKMIGFKGNFKVNAALPSLCGIGKGVALGFGTIVSDKKKRGDGDEE